MRKIEFKRNTKYEIFKLVKIWRIYVFRFRFAILNQTLSVKVWIGNEILRKQFTIQNVVDFAGKK